MNISTINKKSISSTLKKIIEKSNINATDMTIKRKVGNKEYIGQSNFDSKLKPGHIFPKFNIKAQKISISGKSKVSFKDADLLKSSKTESNIKKNEINDDSISKIFSEAKPSEFKKLNLFNFPVNGINSPQQYIGESFINGCQEVSSFVESTPDSSKSKVLLSYSLAIVYFLSNMLDSLNKDTILSGETINNLTKYVSKNSELNGCFAKLLEESTQSQQEAALKNVFDKSVKELKKQIISQKKGFKRLIAPILSICTVILGALLIAAGNALAAAGTILSVGSLTVPCAMLGAFSTLAGYGLCCAGTVSSVASSAQIGLEQEYLNKLEHQLSNIETDINNPSISLIGFTAEIKSDIEKFNDEVKILNDICQVIQLISNLFLTIMTFGALGEELVFSQIIAFTILVGLPTVGNSIGQIIQLSSDDKKANVIGQKISAYSSIGGAITETLNAIINQIEEHDIKNKHKEGETAKMITMAIGLITNFILLIVSSKLMFPAKPKVDTSDIEMDELNNLGKNKSEELSTLDKKDQKNAIVKLLGEVIEKLNNKVGKIGNFVTTPSKFTQATLQHIDVLRILQHSLTFIEQDMNAFITFCNILADVSRNDATQLNNTGIIKNNQIQATKSNLMTQIETNNLKMNNTNQMETSINKETIETVKVTLSTYKNMLAEIN